MICVAANPAEDSTLVVERLEPGAIHRPREVSRRPGGKAVNVARTARALGESAAVVALLPAIGGGAFSAALEEEGIGLTAVDAEGSLRRCTSILDASSGEMTDLYERGGGVGGGAWRRFAGAVLDRCRSGQQVVFSGSIPPGPDPSAFGDLVRAATAAGAAVALDTSDAALAAAVGAAVALVKVNELEARSLTGTASGSEDTLVLALRDLFGTSTKAVVTLGARGAIAAADGGGVLRATLDRAPGSYPVGSGDAFLAGYLVAAARGGDDPARLRHAVAAGAANADVIGAGAVDPALVAALTGEVAVTDGGSSP